MSTSLAISLALAALYLIFLFWYGGRGTTLTRAEIDQALGRPEGGSTCKADPSIETPAKSPLLREYV